MTERHRRARKIKPQLAEGELVRVAWARNQAEAEFIQGLLLEEGVPSVLRRSAGFDVPDFLAAGPRDILVPQSGVDTAREVLLQAEVISPEPAAGGITGPAAGRAARGAGAGGAGGASWPPSCCTSWSRGTGAQWRFALQLMGSLGPDTSRVLLAAGATRWRGWGSPTRPAFP